jgi:hypothetical protein
MSSTLAKALLKEIPLGDIEVYLQTLDSDVMKNRSAQRADNGDWCGGGCDAKGGACGAWCLVQNEQTWGVFDEHGHSDVSKQDFENAIKDPATMRKALSEELMNVHRGLESGKPALGRKINAELFFNR